MNHLPTEEEDQGFQEGRAVAQYLDETPCPHGKENSHCRLCIQDAVSVVHDQFAERHEREKRPRIDLRKRTEF